MRFCSQHFTSLSASCLERGLNWKLSGLLRFFPFIFRVDIKNSVNVLWMSSSLSSHLRYVAIEKLRTLQKWTFQSKNPHWPVCHIHAHGHKSTDEHHSRRKSNYPFTTLPSAPSYHPRLLTLLFILFCNNTFVCILIMILWDRKDGYERLEMLIFYGTHWKLFGSIKSFSSSDVKWNL